MPYYYGIDAAAANLINFFNEDDYALDLWLTNQNFKPEAGFQYNASTNKWGLTYEIPQDTYTIFASGAEARSFALGATPSVQGPFDRARQIDLNLPPYSFGGNQDGHSAQFYSTNMVRAPYWRELLDSFGL